MKKLEKKYNFAEIEKKWQQYWQEANIFKFDWNDTKREHIYSIDTPPPHVSGALHMGHIFGYSQMDTIARFQRMLGKNVFYPVGFDDNGLPSERYVEKKIGKKSKSMDRQEFVKICDKEIQDAEEFMKDEFIKMNYSFDFDATYRTISPTARKVSQMSFLDLYNKKKIYSNGETIMYRKEEPIIWDVVDQTALAQTEAEDADKESQMNYLKFECADVDKNFLLKNENGWNIFKNLVLNFIVNNNSLGFTRNNDKGFSVHNHKNNTEFSISLENFLSYYNIDNIKVLTESLKVFFNGNENKRFISETKEVCKNKNNITTLEIMTTRPELLPACIAVFAHPDDKDKYLGKKVITPLGVEVPILFDESVDKEKGTGVMMCCTFGDTADVEKYKKYNLPLKIIINEKGCLYFDNVSEIDEKYKSQLSGLFTDKARDKILEILKEEGKITREPEKIIHTVKVGERSKSPLEILVKSQWNINVLDMKEDLHKKADEVNWHPEWMKGRIHSWIDGLNWNWTISRQRFFGVPVPCWYSKKDGSVILPSVEQLPVDPTVDLPEGYTADEVVGETDVFDTWMTSSVSPQLSIQAITEDLSCDKERAKILNLPFDLRTQGHDIIRTWAFCTLAKAHLHQNTIPWKNIFVNGFCLASDGTKMSKSKGNGVDPVKTINEFGADAVRYWALSSQLGTDTNYSTDMIKMGQKLITKLFNSAKFAEMNFENLVGKTITAKDDISNGLIFETIDKWLISKVYSTINQTTKALENYEYGKALEVIDSLFWNDFCDNYLEIVKVRCYGANGLKYQGVELSKEEKEKIDKSQQSAIRTIYYTFNAILKLFAPFVPTICDEIYSCIYENEFNKTKSISSRSNCAKVENFVENKDIEEIGKVVLDTIANVRKEKSEKNISIKELIEEVKIQSSLNDKIKNDSGLIEDLKNVCNIKEVKFI
ncbi:MAG: valine--tRNA ligase [Rickettsiales bacterium]|nr:valine--tRNA ligase [Rickettsiales bacterium]